MKGLYEGDVVKDRHALKAFTGRTAADRIVGDLRRKAFLFNYEQLAINYGESVDFQLRREQVILCPQTVEFLYDQFTPTKVRYKKGSRPALEKVARQITAGLEDDQEKALAIMRFCRDLYQRAPKRDFSQYIYGGTEEQLIEKGEVLCECLGRLFVALCEVSDIPARIVMHDIGGHICAEAYVNGHWGYLDPTTGVYCLKPDGRLASTWEIWTDPSLLRAQADRVRADISKRWTWEERIRKCETMYFHPSEVTGIENYSLADAGRYNYFQLPAADVRRAGLLKINKAYVAASRAVFGLENELWRYFWPSRPLRRVPLSYRSDGFSQWYHKAPMTREDVERELIDPFAKCNVKLLEWGLGPGSVFCYDTKVGEIFGANLTPEQWKLMRKGDRNVFDNVTGLIEAGHDPLRIAVERGHQLGLKVFARLEMNHEYGPPKNDNWLWLAFVGSLNKKHPEYRIPGSVLLDFKHREVRDFKLAILREAAETGMDGLSLDFAVYPPFFEKPDSSIMSQFIADVRAMLDEVGKKQNRRLSLMVRVPAHPETFGLDWRTWMKRKWIDIIVPANGIRPEYFDIPTGDYLVLGKKTGCQVYGCIWHSLGFVDTDPRPDGKRRFDKPKTRGMFYAQALLYHRAGADGIQLAMPDSTAWRRRPWYDDLADPEKIQFANKHYMVDPGTWLPVRFSVDPKSGQNASTRLVMLRVADDLNAARAAGYAVKTTLVVTTRSFAPGETMELFVNGSGPIEIASGRGARAEPTAAIDPRHRHPDTFANDPNWWRKGERRIPVSPALWRPGANTIRFVYRRNAPIQNEPPVITWVDLLIEYDRP